LSGRISVGRTSAKADLREANLRQAKVIGANLSTADLSGAQLWATNLSGAKSRFSGAGRLLFFSGYRDTRVVNPGSAPISL